MSLNSVELQIAVPRTMEAGKIHNELQQRPALDQQQLAGQNVKQSQELAQRSTEVDDPSEAALRDDGGRGEHGGSDNASERRHKPEGIRDAEHPFKGRRIDLSL
ncbi:hypothetical protein GCM10010912_26460 [Paenibacillus albidus]|uniref:RNA polymerase subunit sigma n=1 Tax=Paenibacillus albidus TaxID=2041023 RepID=A0A917FGE9_9BACL|nr:hypothetical protein [Paenibacillus albidus]GGF80128.1 hypothetical protein GCM10010912_26460 [Paenibacillus albidus]